MLCIYCYVDAIKFGPFNGEVTVAYLQAVIQNGVLKAEEQLGKALHPTLFCRLGSGEQSGYSHLSGYDKNSDCSHLSGYDNHNGHLLYGF